MSDPHDTTLGEWYRASRNAGEHPPEEHWVRLAAGGMSAAERDALADHVVRCGACAEVWRAVSSLREGASAFDPAARPRRRPSWPILWGVAAAGAAAVLVWAVRPQSTLPSAPRPVPTAELRTGASSVPVPLRPEGLVAGGGLAFEWQPMANARSYKVQLLDARGELLWASPHVAGTGVGLPPEKTLAPGRYHWLVVAQPEGVGEPVSSRALAFEIAPEPGRRD